MSRSKTYLTLIDTSDCSRVMPPPLLFPPASPPATPPPKPAAAAPFSGSFPATDTPRDRLRRGRPDASMLMSGGIFAHCKEITINAKKGMEFQYLKERLPTYVGDAVAGVGERESALPRPRGADDEFGIDTVRLNGSWKRSCDPAYAAPIMLIVHWTEVIATSYSGLPIVASNEHQLTNNQTAKHMDDSGISTCPPSKHKGRLQTTIARDKSEISLLDKKGEYRYARKRSRHDRGYARGERPGTLNQENIHIYIYIWTRMGDGDSKDNLHSSPPLPIPLPKKYFSPIRTNIVTTYFQFSPARSSRQSTGSCPSRRLWNRGEGGHGGGSYRLVIVLGLLSSLSSLSLPSPIRSCAFYRRIVRCCFRYGFGCCCCYR